MHEKTIKLPCFGIEVTLTGDGGSAITSDLKEICPYCKELDCNMSCFEFRDHCSDRDEEEQMRKWNERYEFLAHRAAADALESFIMACGGSGVDIESLAFIEAVEMTYDALANADFTVTE